MKMVFRCFVRDGPVEPQAKKSWLVYILRCRDKSLYTGITNNIEKRLAAHLQGIASKYTRGRLPLKLLATSGHMSKGEALRLEMKIKKLPKEKKLAAFRMFAQMQRKKAMPDG
jgi:putative endonuclease